LTWFRFLKRSANIGENFISSNTYPDMALKNVLKTQKHRPYFIDFQQHFPLLPVSLRLPDTNPLVLENFNFLRLLRE
tara:strand:+ start:500 stop:730 length:231 start_codon:yes stop_codon:yes gene_type:complete